MATINAKRNAKSKVFEAKPSATRRVVDASRNAFANPMVRKAATVTGATAAVVVAAPTVLGIMKAISLKATLATLDVII